VYVYPVHPLATPIVNTISYKPFVGISTHNFDAVRHNNELIRFRGQTVEGQGHSETHTSMVI